AARWRALCVSSAVVALVLSGAVGWWGVLPGEVPFRTAVRRLGSPGAVGLAQRVSEAGTWRGLVPATLGLLVLSARARQRWWLWSALLALTPLLGEAWQEL